MLLLLSAPVDACIGRMMPFKDKPELYSDIFEATVMMVEITGSSFSIGFSPKHTLTVEIKETLKGNKAGTITIENITGCGVPVPAATTLVTANVSRTATRTARAAALAKTRRAGGRDDRSLDVIMGFAVDDGDGFEACR